MEGNTGCACVHVCMCVCVCACVCVQEQMCIYIKYTCVYVVENHC